MFEFERLPDEKYTRERARELANHLNMRARINETISVGEPIDYGAIKAWAPVLREAAEFLMRIADQTTGSLEKP